MKQQLSIANATRQDGHTGIRLQYSLTTETGHDVIESISIAVFLGNENWTLLAAQEAALQAAASRLQLEIEIVRKAIRAAARKAEENLPPLAAT